MARPPKRGPYRKTKERREAIIKAALEEYATSDAGGPTLKAIAQRVGITESALLYHFGSREELFWAIIQARDEQDRFAADDEPLDAEGFTRLGQLIAHNAETPGLVRLFMEFAVAAASPTHPAHGYLRDRYDGYTTALAQSLQTAKGVDADTAAWLARLLVAAADGLQIQWLLDDRVDMRRDLERLVDHVLAGGDAAAAETTPAAVEPQ
ncbi:MAG: TetR family transcriptional regulator [Propionibacteriaceae bacterium]|nr:TetR family transcriptional regulator [Propionibacteriaceae bacterium]